MNRSEITPPFPSHKSPPGSRPIAKYNTAESLRSIISNIMHFNAMWIFLCHFFPGAEIFKSKIFHQGSVLGFFPPNSLHWYKVANDDEEVKTGIDWPWCLYHMIGSNFTTESVMVKSSGAESLERTRTIGFILNLKKKSLSLFRK